MRIRVARPVLLIAAACLTALTMACSAIDPAPDPAPVNTEGYSTGANLIYYVSLGDSLSQGVQPVGSGGAQENTSQGYANDVYTHYRPKLGSTFTLVKLGCSGETSTSMLTGAGSPCYRQGSQLATALAFIKAHRSRIALITIDIGANDIVPCVSGTSISASCKKNGFAEATRDLPKILSAIRKAAASTTVIAGMTLYDPWLAYYLLGGAGRTVAEQSLTLIEQLNQLLTTEYRTYGVKKADVQGAFDTTDYTQADIPEGGTAPLDVARICDWTWMCTSHLNIHANASGYQQIANAYVRIVGVLRKPG